MPCVCGVGDAPARCDECGATLAHVAADGVRAVLCPDCDCDRLDELMHDVDAFDEPPSALDLYRAADELDVSATHRHVASWLCAQAEAMLVANPDGATRLNPVEQLELANARAGYASGATDPDSPELVQTADGKAHLGLHAARTGDWDWAVEFLRQSVGIERSHRGENARHWAPVLELARQLRERVRASAGGAQ